MTELTNAKRRDPYFDNLKLFLIFMVVLGHFLEVAQASSLAPCGRFVIYTFHMPLFIFVSGLFFVTNDIKKGINKFCQFMVLFLAMKIVSWAVNAILNHSYGFSLLDTSGMPWFIFALGIWSLITPIMLRYIDGRILIVISVLTALIVGYDSNINSFLVLSRIIVFWPFFLAGCLLDREKVKAFVKKKAVICAGIIILLIGIALIYLHFDEIRVINPMLSGQNPYSTLNDLSNKGFLIRAFTYCLAILFGVSIMAIVPKKNLIVTGLGERTLGVYFYDMIVYTVTVYAFTGLHFWQYVIISVVLVILLSSKPLYAPIRILMNGIPVPKRGR